MNHGSQRVTQGCLPDQKQNNEKDVIGTEKENWKCTKYITALYQCKLLGYDPGLGVTYHKVFIHKGLYSSCWSTYH